MPKLRLTLFFAFAWLSAAPLLAQDKKPPLKCGTDFEGGVPYLFSPPRDPDGPKVGFEVDLVKALAKQLGRPIEFVNTAFESLPNEVARGGKLDLAINGLEISPANLRHVRFTRPYYIYQLQLVARIDDNRFTTLDECKALGLKVGTIGNSAAAQLIKDKGIDFRLYDNQDNPFDDLRDHTLDAVLFDVPITLYYVVPDDEIEHRKKNFPNLKLVGAPFAEGFYGIAVKKGNETLAKELDDALGEIIKSGEMKRILTKWHLWSPDQYRLYTPLKTESASTEELGFFSYFFLLLEGAGYTVFITFAGMALAVALGLPIATARLYGPLPVRWLAIAYVEFFRGIPVLLLLYFLYFGLPGIDPNLKLHPLAAAIIGFGLNYAAYEAEIYRGGIQAVPVGQWEAAASLGMSPFLTFRRVIFPQSVRGILPPMTNDFIALFKDTSVVSIISVVELSKQYQILTKSYGGYLQIGLTTAALYLVMSVPLSHLSGYLEKRWGAK